MQKEGAKRVTLGIIAFPMNFLVNGNDPIPIYKDGCSQEVFKVKNEQTFPYDDTLLYIVYLFYILIENYQFSMDYFIYF